MKLLHLADLHLGKTVLEAPMLEEQEAFLKKILELVDERGVDAVLMAGDLYDRSVPPAEAVELLDGFLSALSGRGYRCWPPRATTIPRNVWISEAVFLPGAGCISRGVTGRS